MALSILIDWFPYLFSGIVLTLGLVASALIIGVGIGLPMALGQVYGSLAVRSAISLYVWFFRGLPVLVLLFLFYFGIFPALKLDLPAFYVNTIILNL
jgi:polar amino acid transport system permease protein